jgi:hypothetical protein
MTILKRSGSAAARPTAKRTSLWGSWLAGLVLGAISGLVSISFVLGVLAVPFLLAAIGLILWKGPRLLAGAGLLTGHGLLWLVLLLRVQLACGPGALLAEDSCQSDDLIGWISIAAVLFLGGLIGSALALTRTKLER